MTERLERLERIASAMSIGGIRRHMFLCAQQRNPRCSTYEESARAWRQLKSATKALNLATAPPGWRGNFSRPAVLAAPGDGTVLRSKVDCLRVCEQGPIAVGVPRRRLVSLSFGGRPGPHHQRASRGWPPSRRVRVRRRRSGCRRLGDTGTGASINGSKRKTWRSSARNSGGPHAAVPRFGASSLRGDLPHVEAGKRPVLEGLAIGLREGLPAPIGIRRPTSSRQTLQAGSSAAAFGERSEVGGEGLRRV